MILWLAVPLIWLSNCQPLGTITNILERHSRGESDTTSILLKLGVIETLLQGQSTRP